jgi:high-affinity iron transporter
MLATGIIVFREAIEAGLIVGIVLAATRGVPGRGLFVTLGVGAGVLGACIVALFAGAIADAFDGAGQELLNAAILAVAVVMLTWHVVWMSSHGRQMAAELRLAGSDVAAGRRPLSALSVVVGVAVLREGFEVVLFLAGIAVGGDGWPAMLVGGALGLALAVGLTALTYAGLVRIPARHLFSVTGWLVTLLAAGLAAQAAGLLQQGGFIDALQITVWDSSRILSDASIAGRMLHTLVGYTDRPSALQVVVYALTLAAILLLSRRQQALAAPAR